MHLLFTAYASASGIVFHSINHQVTYDQKITNGFSEQVYVNGSNLLEESILKVYYGELKRLSDIKIEYKNNKGKLKSIKNNEILEGDVSTGSFMSDLQVMNAVIPQTQEFACNYKFESAESMLFTSMNFYERDKCKKTRYSISLPENLSIAYILPPEMDKWGELKIDSSRSDGSRNYIFEYAPSDSLMDYYESENSSGVLKKYHHIIRVTVYPTDYPGGVKSYFNNWYLNHISKVPRIKQEVKHEIDEAVKNSLNKEDSIESVFEWVKNKINYIDIEVGINSFIPRDPNEICYKQKGDCKDMAFLIYQLLDYLGFESYVAISSSISHHHPMDFPSISSANHVICIVKIDDSYIPLDATDNLCQYPQPSRHIQDRQVFIINHKGGEYYRIPFIEARDNTTMLSMNLNFNSKEIVGSYDFQLMNLSSYRMKQIYADYTLQDFNNYIEWWFDEKTNKTKIVSYEVENLPNSFSILGTASFSNAIISRIVGKHYVSLAFIPFPHDLSLEIEPNERLISYMANSVKFTGKLHFDQGMELSNPISVSYDNNGLFYSLKIEQKRPNQIDISYVFTFDHITLDTVEMIQNYKKMNEIIVNSLNTKLILE